MSFSMRESVEFGISSFFRTIAIFFKLMLVFLFYTIVAMIICVAAVFFVAIIAESQGAGMLSMGIILPIAMVLLVYYFYYQSLHIGFSLINKEPVTLNTLFLTAIRVSGLL